MVNLISFFIKIFYPKATLYKNNDREKKIIISLTSIPPRIGKIHRVILRILNQTIKADRIIIYVGKEQFAKTKLPLFLKAIMNSHGVEVEYVEDIGPHTKYFYAITHNPNEIVITVDDDIRYPDDMIAVLMKSYELNPKAISARRCHLITFDEQGNIKKYNEWIHKYKEIIDTPSMKLFATGVGGVLYPPKLLPTEAFNLDNLKKLALKNDDLWLKYMEVLNRIPVVATKPFVIKHVKGSQKVALNQQNVGEQRNDTITKDVLGKYNEYFGKEDTILSRIQNNK